MAKKKQQRFPIASQCHPTKVAVTKDGRCRSCYMRDRKRAAREIPTIIDKLEDAQKKLLTLQEAVSQAQQELLESLPAAARSMRKAMDEGEWKAAEAVLSLMPIPGANGKTTRLLELPAKEAQVGASQPTILIGVHITPPTSQSQLPEVIEVTKV